MLNGKVQSNPRNPHPAGTRTTSRVASEEALTV